MKVKYFIIISVIFWGSDCYSQNIVSVIKDFYNNADMNCYLDKAQKRMVEEYELLARWDPIFGLHVPLPSIDLHQNNIVPILNIQFVNTENYSYTDDIYNHITIDSVWTFTFVSVNKRKKVNAVINSAAPYVTYCISDRKSRDDKKWQHVETKFLKSINKYKPEFILRCAVIAGWHGDDGIMYIKDNKIYKYAVYKEKSYELNEYFRMIRLDDIRNYLNKSYIPLIYQDECYPDPDIRCTGNAPENEKMICSSLYIE